MSLRKKKVQKSLEISKKHNVADTETDGIVEIIGAKGMTYEPKTKLDGILIDVDFAYISSKNYEDYTSLLK